MTHVVDGTLVAYQQSRRVFAQAGCAEPGRWNAWLCDLSAPAL